MPTQEWPRRGTHWDVFNADGDLEIERLDEAPYPFPDCPRYSKENHNDCCDVRA